MIVVIGASLGGTKVVRRILRALPATFPWPLAITLHRYREADEALLTIMGEASTLPVLEVTDKDEIRPGTVYLAPPDYHLLVEPTCFSLSVDNPVQYARPSIDVLFESAADAFGPEVIALVLTGANHDGAAGAARVQGRGGVVLIQDPHEAECGVMPQAAIDSTVSPLVLKMEELIGKLIHLAAAGRAVS